MGRKLTSLICLCGLCLALFSSCDDSRLYDDYHDFDEQVWPVDSVQRFTFSISDTSQKYRLFHLVRNSADYSYYNLYIKFTLEDSLHQVIQSELQEVILFDPKTGNPYGSGLGDIFSHEFPALEGFAFPHEGNFTFSVQQYMRTQALPGIQSIGLRIETEAGK